jgi:hypothetical protein
MNSQENSKKYVWVEVIDFDPAERRMVVRLVGIDGGETILNFLVKGRRDGKIFESQQYSEATTPNSEARENIGDGQKFDLVLSRPK